MIINTQQFFSPDAGSGDGGAENESSKQAAAEALLGNNKDGEDGKGKTTQQQAPASAESNANDEQIFTLGKISQRESDGKFVLPIDDETVYVGDSPDDVISQSVEGRKKANNYIKQLKNVSDRFKVSAEKIDKTIQAGETDALSEIQAPDENKIYRKHLDAQARAAHIDPKMLTWEDPQWTKYQEDNSLKDWQIANMVRKRDEVLGRAEVAFNAEITTANQAYVNLRNLSLEREKVGKALDDLLATTDIDESLFDFDAMFEEAAKDKDKQGFIIPGALMDAYRKQEKKLLAGKSIVKKDLDDNIRKNNEKKGNIRESGGGPKPGANTKRQSMESAEEEIRKGIKQGKY